MRASEKAREPRHANRFNSDAERAIAGIVVVGQRIDSIETDRKIKTGRRLKLMKATLQRGPGSLKEDTSPGCRERIGEARDFGIVQRLGTGNPKDGRPIARNESAGLRRTVSSILTADRKRRRTSLKVNVGGKPQNRRIARLGADCAGSQSQSEIRGEPQRKRHCGL